MRGVLKELLPRPGLFGPAMKLGQVLRPLLPAALKAKVPPAQAAGPWPAATHKRRMLALAGCVQPAMLPNINAADRARAHRARHQPHRSRARPAAAARCVFTSTMSRVAKTDARRNIDAWWPHVEAGAEAIVVTASGCGVQVKDYGHLLRDDPAYAGKAERVAALARDVAEVVAAEGERLTALLAAASPADARRVAFHAPCTLQHGRSSHGVVESLLLAAGFELTPVADSHLCCGSAGTYSVLQAGDRRRAARQQAGGA